MELSLSVAFIVGLFSAVHCWGMCGGIIGALSFGVPEQIREKTGHFSSYLFVFNLGRIISYMLAGAILGTLGGSLSGFISIANGHMWLRWTAAMIMVGIGLYIAGWFPQFARLEQVGSPLWRRLEPLSRRLLPVRSRTSALAFGILWGWLPCGLVYSMLIAATGLGDPLSGAAYMGAFGLGTLPATLAAGFLAGRLFLIARKPGVRQAVGLSVMLLGLLTLVFQGYDKPLDFS